MRFKTFTGVVDAVKSGRLPKGLRLVYYTSDCRVELAVPKRGPEPDDYDEEVVYRAESLEDFMLDVARTMGWEGEVS